MAHDVGLHGVAIAHVGDIADVDGGSVGLANGQPVEGYGGIGRAVQFDRVFLSADLHRAGRHDDALRVDGVGNVAGGEPLGEERARVEIDRDLARAAAIGQRKGGAFDIRHLRADEVVTVIVKLLLAEGIA